MKEENNLVRKLESSETMGGANEICTDKTGTLTKNLMTVKEFYTMDTVFQGRPSNFNDLATSKLMAEGVLYNCSARIEKSENGSQEPKGNVTEQGLIRCLMEMNVNCLDPLLKKQDFTLHLIPFNSSRKRAATCIRHPDNSNLVRAYCKGAPEIVLQYVTKMYDKNGKIVPIDEAQKEQIRKKIVSETFAVKAYRTLLIAHADYTYDEYLRLKDANNNFAGESDREALEQGLTLIGIYALQDPLRDEVIQSVRICHRAGINIRMVTGDNIDTAKAIALEAGILKQEHKDRKYAVMDGKTFREACGGLRKIDTGSELLREEIVNKEEFKLIAASLQVLGRSTPEDKYMLVTGLRELGNTVAVTGDGTNDAPALKRADVGFAMGISGTEVAKEAADIILLDDNFKSIVTAVKWGRNIYSSVRKFLQFQLVINIGAIFIIMTASVVLAPDAQPLGALQLLWINVLMDTFAALALATEPPSLILLEQKPYSRAESIVTPVMWRNIFGQAAYQLVVFFLLLFLVPANIIPYSYFYDGEMMTGDVYAKYFLKNTDGTNVSNDYFGKCPVNPDSYPTASIPFIDCGYINTVKNSFDENPIRARHYGFLFNTYVMLQLFNLINARKLLPNEWNPFQNFFNNKFFLMILIVAIGVQVVLVSIAPVAAILKIRPLTMTLEGISIAIGATSIIFGKTFSCL
jgi:magnesium-transporting ATPase (P-type)